MTRNNQTVNVSAFLIAAFFSMALLSASAAHAITINISAGEDGSDPDQQVIAGQTWNNLVGAATDSTIAFADGTAATGVTAIQAGTGTNPGDVAGIGYIDAAHDTITESLQFSGGATVSSLDIGGLTPGSLWRVSVFAGLDDASTLPPGHPALGRTQDIDVNGTTQTGLGFQAVYDSHAPVVFSSIAADGSGFIKVDALAGSFGSIEFIQAVSITQLPEPTTALLGLMGLGALGLRRRRAAA